MSIVVKNNYVKAAPRKIRAVCNLIRKKPVQEALQVLRFCEKKEQSIMLTKLINSGLSIAVDSEKYELDNLIVSEIFVDEGPTMKRIQPRAQGRAFRVRHRTGHVTLKLDEQQ